MRTRTLAPFVLLLLAVGCKQPPKVAVYQAVPVERRSIVVSARATGTILPDTVVEVKSKASGEILDMKVETGQVVERGTLLVLVDQRTPRNRLNQANADLEVAKARLENAQSQRKRADELFKSQSISQEEHENALLAVANAKDALVSAQVSGENARIAMEDTRVLAPITGTIISKSVERGQVISSPSTDVGGGTVLLKMADLNLVQVRTLVDETDIGKIKPGLRTTVTVGAYPNQPFQGEVQKIEPLAETSQNVTMFPVLVRIQNQAGLLKPGMNSDVEIHIGQRDSVLAVPNASLRTPRDVGSAAQVLGIPDDRLKTMLAEAQKSKDSMRAVRLAAARPSTDTVKVDTIAKKPAGNTYTMQNGRQIELPKGVTAKQVDAIFAKFRNREQLSAEDRQLMQQLGFGGGGGAGGGGSGGGGGGGRMGGGGGFNGRQRAGNDFQFGGDYIVFALRAGKPTPVYVRTGLTDLDYSEVVSGLTQADSVLVLPSASLVQSQQESKNRAAQFTGGLIPGTQQPQQTRPGGAGGAGGGGGGGGQGGGRPPGGGSK